MWRSKDTAIVKNKKKCLNSSHKFQFIVLNILSIAHYTSLTKSVGYYFSTREFSMKDIRRRVFLFL